MKIARFIPAIKDVVKLAGGIGIETIIDHVVGMAFPLAKIPFMKKMGINMGKVVVIGAFELVTELVARKFQHRFRKDLSKQMHPKRKKRSSNNKALLI